MPYELQILYVRHFFCSKNKVKCMANWLKYECKLCCFYKEYILINFTLHILSDFIFENTKILVAFFLEKLISLICKNNKIKFNIRPPPRVLL